MELWINHVRIYRSWPVSTNCDIDGFKLERIWRHFTFSPTSQGLPVSHSVYESPHWHLQTSGNSLCGPVCVSFIVGLEDEQGVVRSRPLDDQCESAETRASQFKVQGGSHPWKTVFKGNIWICHQTLHSEISPMLLILCYLLFVQ